VSRGLLDTSLVIALGRGAEVTLPEEAAISAITLCELHHGVLAATAARRPARLATLSLAERLFAALPVDARVAPHYGRLVSAARKRGRHPSNADALIAATAAAYGLPVHTRDEDFARFPGVEVVRA